MQDKEIGFVFSKTEGTVLELGYQSVSDYIKRLTERGYLGNEIDYNEQIESEIIGSIKLQAEQERIKNNPVEYKRRLLVLQH